MAFPLQLLIAVTGKLYANSTNGFVSSTDGGESWAPLPSSIDAGVLIEAFDDTLYVKRGNDMNSPSPLCHLSTEDHSLKFIPDMLLLKIVNSQKTDEEMSKIMLEAFTDKAKQNLKEGVPPNPEDVDFDQLNETLNKAIQEQALASMMSFIGNFSVSGDTYYVEYGQTLYKWKSGMSEWHNTGLVDKSENAFRLFLTIQQMWLLLMMRLILWVSKSLCQTAPFTSENGMGISFNRLMKVKLGMMPLQNFLFPLRSSTQSPSREKPFM